MWRTFTMYLAYTHWKYRLSFTRLGQSRKCSRICPHAVGFIHVTGNKWRFETEISIRRFTPSLAKVSILPTHFEIDRHFEKCVGGIEKLFCHKIERQILIHLICISQMLENSTFLCPISRNGVWNAMCAPWVTVKGQILRPVKRIQSNAGEILARIQHESDFQKSYFRCSRQESDCKYHD